MPLGISSDGQPVYINIATAPHILIAGATGSGKSVALHTIINGLMAHNTPRRLQFIMIDPKRCEFSEYRRNPFLAGIPVITDTDDATDWLRGVCNTIDKRYKKMQRRGYKNIPPEWPRIVVIADEFANLTAENRTVLKFFEKIAQMGRACGIHLILATQAPRTTNITAQLRDNIPCKIALKCATTTNSVCILGHKGAEKLIGRGDAILQQDSAEIRLQIAL